MSRRHLEQHVKRGGDQRREGQRAPSPEEVEFGDEVDRAVWFK